MTGANRSQIKVSIIDTQTLLPVNLTSLFLFLLFLLLISVSQANAETVQDILPPNPSQSDQIVQTKPPIIQSNLHKLTNLAKQFQKAKYSYGGTDPKVGFDCSGLVLTLVKSVVHNPDLPRSSSSLFSFLNQNVQIKDAQIGDFLFFRTGNGVSHVGMYWGKNAEGKDLMYHISSSHGVQILTFMQDSYWSKRFAGAKRFNPFSLAINADNDSAKYPVNGSEIKVEPEQTLAQTPELIETESDCDLQAELERMESEMAVSNSKELNQNEERNII